MGEFIYIVDISIDCFNIDKHAQIAYDDQELARSVLRKQMELFKERYTPYVNADGLRESILQPDFITIRGTGNDSYFSFHGSIKELFVHGDGANIIAYSGGIVRCNDRPDVMCAVCDTLISYNQCLENFSARNLIDVEIQTEVDAKVLSAEEISNGFTPVTPEEELRYSVALEAINERKIR